MANIIHNLVVANIDANVTVYTTHIRMYMRGNSNDHSNLQLRIISIFAEIPIVVTSIRMNIPESSPLIDLSNPF